MDLFDSRWLQLIPFGVFVASLVGSGHCVAMCGGLVSSVAQTRSQVFEYHLGRLVGYTALGALAGWVGAQFLLTSEFGILPWLSTALIALGFIVMGWRLWTGRTPHLFRIPPALWNRWSPAAHIAIGPHPKVF